MGCLLAVQQREVLAELGSSTLFLTDLFGGPAGQLLFDYQSQEEAVSAVDVAGRPARLCQQVETRRSGCSYRKLDPDVLMVKSTKHRPSFDMPVALNGPSIGGILP